MANISTIDMCRKDLFTSEEELRKEYTEAQIARVLRLRDMYAWMLANPDAKDRQFIEEEMSRGYVAHKSQAYSDLTVIKALVPMLSEASREYHRWRYNEMILETYQMARKRKDTKTMERAATSYAKYNRVDIEDDKALPYNLIVVQPFMATSDPTVLGIKPIPNRQKYVEDLIAKFRAESADIDDVEYEYADLEEDELYAEYADFEEVKEDDLYSPSPDKL